MDLMRALPDAPYGVMEFLFVELMLWGRDQGYVWFNLGMAPVRRTRARRRSAVEPFRFLRAHYGEHFYNFKGVRAFKEQFRPRWSAKYIAIESGLMLPRAAADIAALISGGYRGMVSQIAATSGFRGPLLLDGHTVAPEFLA